MTAFLAGGDYQRAHGARLRIPADVAQRRSPLDVTREWKPSKEETACCQAHLDRLGRPVVGFCGPDCERRP